MMKTEYAAVKPPLEGRNLSPIPQELSRSGRLQELLASRKLGWCLEQPFYTDPEIFAADIETIFNRYWLFAGHISRIQNPGDYFCYETGRDSLIIIRDRENGIHALFNTCRHRGSLICTEPCGNARKLVCPYHQWAYDASGFLLAARHLPKNVDKSQFDLPHAQLRVVEGLIFISLADDPPDFSPVEKDIQEHLGPHHLPRTKICHSMTVETQANWKLIVENSRECYHCPVGHPEYKKVVALATSEESPRQQAVYEELLQANHAVWREMGLSVKDIPFTRERWHHCNRFPLRSGCVSETMDGQPVAPLLGDLTKASAGALGIVIYPGFWLEASSDYVFTMQQTPLNATATRVELNWYVREDAEEGRDYEIDKVIAVWKATALQDKKLAEDNQRGIHSSRFTLGPYLELETELEKFIQWYLDQLQTSLQEREPA